MTAVVDLAAYEATIERGMQSFVEIGKALVAIRDGKLYRASYATFEAYCASRWGWSRQRAYKIIDAAEVTEALSPIGDTPIPANEGQARELVGLPAETAAQVMTEAASTGKVTASAIADARERIAPKLAKITETTKVETHVDTETGEVSSPPTMDAFISSDPHLRRQKYLASLARSIATSGRIASEYDPGEVANAIDPDLSNDLDRLVEGITRWRAAIRAAQPRHLRSV